MTKKLTALIDGDGVVMGAGYASQRTENGVIVEVDPPELACRKAKLILQTIQSKAFATSSKVFVGDVNSKHFRYAIAKTLPYKGNRDSSRRPQLEGLIRDYLINYHRAIVVKGVEVDDALGISQTKDTIICSSDKDLDQIPGLHLDTDYGKERSFGKIKFIMKDYKDAAIYEITDPGFLDLKEKKTGRKVLIGGGQLWFCAQMLMGDKIDNIPGLPFDAKSNYKDVRAYQALKDCLVYKDAIKKVWELYQEKLTKYQPDAIVKDRMLEIARLCWIKRAKKETIFPGGWLT